jgi:hypothetical protein
MTQEKKKSVSYTRQDVLDFLSKVRIKALNTVHADYMKRYNKEFDNIVSDQPRLLYLLGQARSLIGKLQAIKKEAQELIEGSWSHKPGCGSHELSLPTDFKTDLMTHFYDNGGTLKALNAHKEGELNAVRANYNVVYDKINVMRSPLKMRQYLDSLGFDTSYLDREKSPVENEVKTDKLFPCKERGLS